MTVRWDGDRDGDLIVVDDAGEETVIDRLGDAVTVLSGFVDRRQPEAAAVAAYGVCLSTRGIDQPTFVMPILEKAFPFVSGVDPASRVLYDVIKRLREAVAGAGLDGVALRDRVLHEARTIHSEVEKSAT